MLNDILIYIYAISVIIFVALLLIVKKENKKKIKKEISLYENLLSCCEMPQKVNETINKIFKMVSQVIDANEYAFYIIDSKNKQYILKSIHYKNEKNDNLNLSYSGLIPHKNKKYVFPVNVDTEAVPSNISETKTNGTRILNLPIKGGNGFMQIQLKPNFSFTDAKKKAIKEILDRLDVVVLLIMQNEQLRNKIKFLDTAKQATQSVARIINGEGILKMAIGMFSKTINAKGGFFLKEDNGLFEVSVDVGFSKESLVMFKYDYNLHSFFKELIGTKKIVMLSKNDKLFYNIPTYFASEGAKQLILFSVNFDNIKGIAGFWYDNLYEMDDYQASSILMMFAKIIEISNNYLSTTSHSKDNERILKLLSNLVDNLSPFTVGYSSLMQHYATSIAIELKLSQQDIDKISLAAFLSNIGIAALSYDIFLKNGKYSEFDYEVIKLHSEVGADIIEAMYGDLSVSNMVRYHHERVDGCGYPYGLKSDEIPIGAKILSVAQFFIAKISTRNYRDAMPYYQAIRALKHVSNTQLDVSVVNALIDYLEKTKNANIETDGSLDYCFNMRFVPSEICEKCPAKYQKNKKCWEVSGNLCIAHGNKCETCFVYSEYKGRKGL